MPTTRLGTMAVSGSTPSTALATLKSLTNHFCQKIDLSKLDGFKLYNKATVGLKEDDRFSVCRGPKAKNFLRKALKACNDFNWGKICTAIPDSSGKARYLPKAYQHLTLKEVKKNA